MNSPKKPRRCWAGFTVFILAEIYDEAEREAIERNVDPEG
jgi:hypothetical protein